MLLHDINSANADNSVAMQAARQSVDLFRYFPQLVRYLRYNGVIIRRQLTTALTLAFLRS